MSNTIAESFERSIEEIQQCYAAPPGNRREVDGAEFVRLLFRVALEREEISGRCGEDNGVQFQIGDEAPIDYELNWGLFRSMLAAIAGFAREQTPSLPQEEKFNFYGDTQEISCAVDGVCELFSVETFNDGRKSPFRFSIRHVRTQKFPAQPIRSAKT